jgi:hypothetical protein
MRVDELARELEMSDEVLLVALAELTADPPESAESTVPDELADRAREYLAAPPAPAIGAELRETGEALIRRAFDTARLAGKPEWDRMSVAVLKNRILDLSNRAFDEAAFGAASFREWLALFEDVLEIDATRRPAWVRLIDAHGVAESSVAPTPPALVLPPRWRIRSDLWRAVTDLGADGDWYWDGEAAFFHPDALEDAEGAHELPTLTSDDLRALRSAFAHRLRGPDRTSEPLQRWVSELLPDSVLPAHLRGQWVAALKLGVLRRLRTWFDAQDLRAPADLVEESTRGPSRDDPLDDLRSLVMKCVRVMTRSELEELRLSPSVLLRATRR